MHIQSSCGRFRLLLLAVACVMALSLGAAPAYGNEQQPTGDSAAPEASQPSGGQEAAGGSDDSEAVADDAGQDAAADAQDAPAGNMDAALGQDADTAADSDALPAADESSADAPRDAAEQDAAAEADEPEAQDADDEAAQADADPSAAEAEGEPQGASVPAADGTGDAQAKAADAASSEAGKSAEAAAEQAAPARLAEQQAAPKADAAQASVQPKSVQKAGSSAWKASALTMNAGSGQLGATVVLAPVISGNATDLAFRYTIETNDGKDVTLLRRYKRGIPDFSFTLNRSGKVKIKLEVSDYKGNKKVLERTLSVSTPAWNLTKLAPDYQSGGATAFVPKLTGDTRFLRYQYTWTAADGTTKSGTIAPDGQQSKAFKPANGVYDIDVLVTGTDGKTKSAKLSYVAGATRATFNYSLSSKVVKSGKSVTVAASGTDEKGRALSFAYSLGSARGSGAKASLATPAAGGHYPLATKISVAGKQIATRKDTISAWNLAGLNASRSGRTINATANAAGIPAGWTYKFIYSGPDGTGTFSKGKASKARYTVGSGGTYKVTVELYDAKGNKMASKNGSVTIPRDRGEVMEDLAQGYSSATNKLILLNIDDRDLAIYEGSYGNWRQIFFTDVSVGSPSTPTPRGTFTVGSKGYSFDGDVYTCYYWTQISGDYLFHSVLYHRGTRSILDGGLNMGISHGCVRMDIEEARWLQNNVPSGSKIVIY